MYFKLSPMKNLILVSLAFLFSYTLMAQPTPMPKMPIDESTKLITYQDVVMVKGTKDELFTRAIAWVNSFYPNAIDVTKVRDLENGKIECVARYKLFNIDKKGEKIATNFIIQYNLTIELKDDKYKYTITGLNVKAASKQPFEKWLTPSYVDCSPNCETYMAQTDEYMKKLLADLKDKMKPVVKKNDNW